MPNKTNEAGRNLIQGAEGLRLKSYQDPKGIWTIGYGHTGSDVVSGQIITKGWAEYLFEHDLQHIETQISDLLKVIINDNQFSALVSFTYNEGITRLKTSTLLKLINEGQFAAAALEFPKWNKITLPDGTIQAWPGLTKRRQAEATLFLS